MPRAAYRTLAIASLLAFIAGLVFMVIEIGMAVPAGTALLPTADQITAARIALDDHFIGPLLTLGGTVGLAASVRSVELDIPTKKQLRDGFQPINDWVIKLAELVVLLAGFQVAGQKIDAWPIHLMAFAIFACLTIHIFLPVHHFAVGPMRRAIPGQGWVKALMSTLALVALCSVAIWFMLVINSGLRGLIHSAAS